MLSIIWNTLTAYTKKRADKRGILAWSPLQPLPHLERQPGTLKARGRGGRKEHLTCGVCGRMRLVESRNGFFDPFKVLLLGADLTRPAESMTDTHTQKYAEIPPYSHLLRTAHLRRTNIHLSGPALQE